MLVDIDGTPYAVKIARTVWSGGKSGDYIKRLPIAIILKLISLEIFLIYPHLVG